MSVYHRGWVPHTCIAMASTVRLFSRNGTAGDYRQIGVVQSFKPTDTRRTERARGVGFGDRVQEIVPGMTDVSITVTRMALYDENILESFGYYSAFNRSAGRTGAVRTLAHMKNPFDIHEVIAFHVRRSEGALPGFSGGLERPSLLPQDYTFFWYHDCWINSWARTIDVTGNLIYMEDVSIDVTWVDDGVEPVPYFPDNDSWDLHGMNCSTGSFDPGSINRNNTTSGDPGNGANVSGLSGPQGTSTRSISPSTSTPSSFAQVTSDGACVNGESLALNI